MVSARAGGVWSGVGADIRAVSVDPSAGEWSMVQREVSAEIRAGSTGRSAGWENTRVQERESART